MIDISRRVEAIPAGRVSRLRRFLPVALVGMDAALIYVALVLAYWVRYALKVGPQIREQLTFGQYQPIGVMLLCIMIPVLVAKSAYRPRFSREKVDELAAIFSSATISVAAIVVVTAMLHRYEYSRGVILYVWVLLILVLSAGRVLFHSAQAFCHQRGWGVRRLLVVGATDTGKMVMQRVMGRPDLGYELIGFVDHRDTPHIEDFGRFRALGTLSDIPDLVDSGAVDDIVVALPASAHEDVWPVLTLCEHRNVGLKIVPDLFEMSLSRVQMDDLAGIPLFDVQDPPLRRLAKGGKRLMDVGVAAAGLALAAPFLAVLCLLIRIESPGSPLLVQERVGLGGRRFRCLKLRTMYTGSEGMQSALQAFNEVRGPIFKMRHDPRRTRLGRLIRRWSLDELPQIWNVLVGEMSLVGPRPPLPSEVEHYEARHMRRLEAKPGMTGLWQVSGRSELQFEEMVMMDIYYVDRWSLMLDAQILIRTVVTVLARHGAY